MSASTIAAKHSFVHVRVKLAWPRQTTESQP